MLCTYHLNEVGTPNCKATEFTKKSILVTPILTVDQCVIMNSDLDCSWHFSACININAVTCFQPLRVIILYYCKGCCCLLATHYLMMHFDVDFAYHGSIIHGHFHLPASEKVDCNSLLLSQTK